MEEKRKEKEEEEKEGDRGKISRRKILGEHVKEGKNISSRVVPPSLPPCRSSRSGASNGEKRKGEVGEGERWGEERKTRRNGPTAQQKRDKSSTLIRILPLFALWNTILNGMGAQ